MPKKKGSAAAGMAKSLLIATPTVAEDSLFHGSLIYLDRNRAEGSTGLIVNKPSDVQVVELLKTVGVSSGPRFDEVSSQPVYVGGPVNTSRLYVLYGEPRVGEEDSLRMRITSSEKILSRLVSGEGPRKYMIMLGCSMWRRGQLEREYAENSWVRMDCVPEVIFDAPPDERALIAARHLGFNLSMLHV